MKVIQKIYQDYQNLDNLLALEEDKIRNRGSKQKTTEIQRKRYYNDQSTFLFLFSRFEGKVNDYSILLSSRKSQSARNSNLKRSSPWEIFDFDRISFMNKVALLTRKGQTDYNLIYNYYQARNEIAHGNFLYSSSSIAIIFQDLVRLYKSLKP